MTHKIYKILFCISLVLLSISCKKLNNNSDTGNQSKIVTAKGNSNDLSKIPLKYGAEILIEKHLHELKGKRVAIVANQTTMVYEKYHLVDTLLKAGIHIVKVFAPEHGFRGKAEAGETVNDQLDDATKLPVVSLYGNNKKPTDAQLADVDIVLYDIQDVGARFYTYISTLSYVMEACSQNGKRLIVLDRPNPNGDYVDGPLMTPKNVSFVGMHPIPIVHGLTMGEYAMMVKGEGWLDVKYNSSKLNLTIIGMEGYYHSQKWHENNRKWVAPSPNLPTPESARYYPILCWFEGTLVSVGRGTELPFEQIGFPFHIACQKQFKKDSIIFNKVGNNSQGHTNLFYEGINAHAVEFKPKSIKGKAFHPPHEGVKCYGIKIDSLPHDSKQIFLAGTALLKNFYDEYYAYHEVKELPKPSTPFFNSFFERLSGSNILRKSIESNTPPAKIVELWKSDIATFKKARRKYLLYKDFE